MTPSEGLDLRPPLGPWPRGGPAPPEPIGRCDPGGVGALGRKPLAGQTYEDEGPQRATLWALGTSLNDEGKRCLVGVLWTRCSPSASELMELGRKKEPRSAMVGDGYIAMR